MISRRAASFRTKTSHERWLVSYSDFITLLFAFFVVMYSVSQVSENKYRVLSETLATVFQGKVPITPEEKALLEKQSGADAAELSGLSAVESLAKTKDMASDISDALVHLVKAGDVTVNATEEWLQLDLSANILFATASAELKSDARKIFEDIATVLAPFENAIEVSGHTDNVPIETDIYQSNWELSAARAAAVVKVLDQNGVAPTRLSAVGYGEFHPVAPNDSEQGRAQNRRVVLLVARTTAERRFINIEEMAAENSGVSSPADGLEQAMDAQEGADGQASQPADGMTPIRRDNGNLLFTSDPDLPRDN